MPKHIAVARRLCGCAARYDGRMIDVLELEARVRAFVAERVPALAGGRAVIAVSGGADSIATAALLCEAGIVQPESCVVAHFDHRLRGDAATGADRRAVEALCARYGFGLECGHWDAPRRGEAAAREARYAFVARVADDHDAVCVATGHTADDQAETIVMHMLRGSGLHGLCGLQAERPFPMPRARPGLQLSRPALCLSRAETRAYCAARGLGFVDDPSNEDRSFLRNRVRLEMLPEMERAAPGARAALLALADEASESIAALDAVAATALGRETSGVATPHVTLSRAALRELPDAVRPYAFRAAFVRVLGDAREFDRRHYRRLGATCGAATGSVFELPRGVVVTVDADAIIISVGVPGYAAVPDGFVWTIPFEGQVGAWWLSVGASYVSGAMPDWVEVSLPDGAVVRGRRPGDRVALAATGRHKKLQDYYVDRKVARRERDSAPVIARGNDVLWTPFGHVDRDAGGSRFLVRAERRSA